MPQRGKNLGRALGVPAPEKGTMFFGVTYIRERQAAGIHILSLPLADHVTTRSELAYPCLSVPIHERMWYPGCSHHKGAGTP